MKYLLNRLVLVLAFGIAVTWYNKMFCNYIKINSNQNVFRLVLKNIQNKACSKHGCAIQAILCSIH